MFVLDLEQWGIFGQPPTHMANQVQPFFKHGIPTCGGTAVFPPNCSLPGDVTTGSASSLQTGQLIVAGFAPCLSRCAWTCQSPAIFSTAVAQQLHTWPAPTPQPTSHHHTRWTICSSHTRFCLDCTGVYMVMILFPPWTWIFPRFTGL